MSPKSRSFPEDDARIRSSSPCARMELPSTRKRWIANRGGAGGLEGAAIGGRNCGAAGAWDCGLEGCGFVGACAIARLAHSASSDPAAAPSKRLRNAYTVGIGATLTLPGQESKFSHGRSRRGKRPEKCDLFTAMSSRAKTQGSSGFALQIVQWSAAEGRETGTEDESRVAEVGTGDDAFGDRRLSFSEVGCDQLLGEFGRNAARGAFARLAVLPDVEAAAGFLAEISRGDELGELPRRLRALARQFLPHREADVQAHRVGQLDRSHRHAERRDCRVECLRRDTLVDHVQRLVDVGTEHAIDEKARRVLD